MPRRNFRVKRPPVPKGKFQLLLFDVFFNLNGGVNFPTQALAAPDLAVLPAGSTDRAIQLKTTADQIPDNFLDRHLTDDDVLFCQDLGEYWQFQNFLVVQAQNKQRAFLASPAADVNKHARLLVRAATQSEIHLKRQGYARQRAVAQIDFQAVRDARALPVGGGGGITAAVASQRRANIRADRTATEDAVNDMVGRLTNPELQITISALVAINPAAPNAGDLIRAALAVSHVTAEGWVTHTPASRKADRVCEGDTLYHVAARNRLPTNKPLQFLRALLERQRPNALILSNSFGNNLLHELATTKKGGNYVMKGLLRQHRDILFNAQNPATANSDVSPNDPTVFSDAACLLYTGAADENAIGALIGGPAANSPYEMAAFGVNGKSRTPHFRAIATERESRATRLCGNRRSNGVLVSATPDVTQQTAGEYSHSFHPDSVRIKARENAYKSMRKPETIASLIFSLLNIILALVDAALSTDEKPCYEAGLTTAAVAQGGSEEKVIITSAEGVVFYLAMILGLVAYSKACNEWREQAGGYFTGFNPTPYNYCPNNGICSLPYFNCKVPRHIRSSFIAMCFAFVVSAAMQGYGLSVSEDQDKLLRVGLLTGASFIFSAAQGLATTAVDSQVDIYELANQVIV